MDNNISTSLTYTLPNQTWEKDHPKVLSLWYKDNTFGYDKFQIYNNILDMNGFLDWVKTRFEPEYSDYATYNNLSKKFHLCGFTGRLKKDINTVGIENILVSFIIYVNDANDDSVDMIILWKPNDDIIKEHAKNISDEFLVFVEQSVETKTSIHMIINQHNNLSLREFEIMTPDIDVSLNYGPLFAEKHEYLINILGKKLKKGICLLHGIPGSGKTMYIRYLASLLSKDRTVIYLPNDLISSISGPNLLPLMASYPNSILIIEDGDEAIKSRKSGGGVVDKILNLADGILSDILGIQIICTFNTGIANIDDALLRKGRLIFKHEFKKLEKLNAQRLADKLGLTLIVEKDMTLSEIYNFEDKFTEDVKEDKRIGF